MTERAKIKLSKTESTKVDRNSSEDNKKVKITEETQPVTPKYTFPVVSQSNSGNIIKRLRPDDILTVKQGKQNNIILYSDLTGSPDLYFEFLVNRLPISIINFAAGNTLAEWKTNDAQVRITNPDATANTGDAIRYYVNEKLEVEYQRGFRRFALRTINGARTVLDNSTGAGVPSSSWTTADPNLGTWNDKTNITTVLSGGATFEYPFTTTGNLVSQDATAATADRQQSFINFLKPWIDSKSADPVEVYIYDGYQLAFHDTNQTIPAKGNLAMSLKSDSDWINNTNGMKDRFPLPDFSKSSHVECRENDVIPWRDYVGIKGFAVDAASQAGDTAGLYGVTAPDGYFEFYRSRNLNIIGEATPMISNSGVFSLNPDLYKLTPYMGYLAATGDAGDFWNHRNWETVLPSETNSEIHAVVQWGFQGSSGFNKKYWDGNSYDIRGITTELKRVHDNGFVVSAAFTKYSGTSPQSEVDRQIVLDYIVELGGSTLDTVNYAVTVVSTDDGNKYFIDGVRQNTMYFRKGRTYKLNLDDSLSGHPFWIQTTDNGGNWDDGNVITSGISRNGANSGTITYTVPSDAPSTLYYRCEFHGGMGGQINIVSV